MTTRRTPPSPNRFLLAALWTALGASVILPLLVPSVRVAYEQWLQHLGGNAPGGLLIGLGLLAVATLVLHLQSERWRPVTRCLLVSQLLHALLILCFQCMRIHVAEPVMPPMEPRVSVVSGLASLTESVESERVREDLLSLRAEDARSLAARNASLPTPAAEPATARPKPAPATVALSAPRPLVDAPSAWSAAPQVADALAKERHADAPDVTNPEVARAKPVDAPVPAPAPARVDTAALVAAKQDAAAAQAAAPRKEAAPLAQPAVAPRPVEFRAERAAAAPLAVAEIEAARTQTHAEKERVALATQDQPLDVPPPPDAAPTHTPASADVYAARREAPALPEQAPAPTPDVARRPLVREASPASLAGDAASAAGEVEPRVTDSTMDGRTESARASSDAVRLAEHMELSPVAAPAEPRAAAASARPTVVPDRQAGAAPTPADPVDRVNAPLRAAELASGPHSLAADSQQPVAVAQQTPGNAVATGIAAGAHGVVIAEAPLDVATTVEALPASAADANTAPPPPLANHQGEAIAIPQAPGVVTVLAGPSGANRSGPAHIASGLVQQPAVLVDAAEGVIQDAGADAVASAVREPSQTQMAPIADGVDELAIAAAVEALPPGPSNDPTVAGRDVAIAVLNSGRAGVRGPALDASAAVQAPAIPGRAVDETPAKTLADAQAQPIPRAAASVATGVPISSARHTVAAAREVVPLQGASPVAETGEGEAEAATPSPPRFVTTGALMVTRTGAGSPTAEAPTSVARPMLPAGGAPEAPARALVSDDAPFVGGAAMTVVGALATTAIAPRAWAEVERLPLADSPAVDQHGELVYGDPAAGRAASASAAAQPLAVTKAAGAPSPAEGWATAHAQEPGTAPHATRSDVPPAPRLLDIPGAMGGHARVAIPESLPEGPRAQTYRNMLTSEIQATTPLTRQKLIYSLRSRERRSALIDELGGSAETEAAVERALRWLATAQSADGHWDIDEFRGVEKNAGAGDRLDGDAGVTGLALLAYLGAGYTQDRGDFQEPIRKALDWLMAGQTPEGDLRRGGQLYCHAMATAALCEAYSLSGEERLLVPAQRAVHFILASQTPGAGWRYEPREDSDTSVTGWKVLALKSAEIAGIAVPPVHFEWTAQWLDRVRRGQLGGLFAYKEGHGATPVMTAEGWFCQLFMDPAKRARGEAESVAYLMENPPAWTPETRGVIHFYYWYYATLALHLSGRPEFESWNKDLRAALLKGQRNQGPAKGSWDPIDQLGERGGRLYSTTMATLCLEVYYRYLPFYQSSTPE
jgi:hypothetical protein